MTPIVDTVHRLGAARSFGGSATFRGKWSQMSLHDRLYAARAARTVQEQERWAEALRCAAGGDGAPLATVTALIPSPRVSAETRRGAPAPEASRP